MTTFQDRVWPPIDDQLADSDYYPGQSKARLAASIEREALDRRLRREIAESRAIARRDWIERRRRERREFLIETAVALAVLAMAIVLIWILAPAWYQAVTP